MSVVRQQVLYLWLDTSSLDGRVLGWAFHDGTAGRGPSLPQKEPPYPNGVAALHDGWCLLQSAQLIPAYPGREHTTSFLQHEFVLERRIDLEDAVEDQT